MPFGKLIRVVLQNVSRSKKNFIFSSIGIIVGISTFTFFIALSGGIRERVLNRIFPIDQLEIEPIGGVASALNSAAGIGPGPRRLDQRALEQIKAVEGVSSIHPKMRARFQAKIETGVLDRRMAGEGFIEGMRVSQQVVDELRDREASCSLNEEDLCRRRQVECVTDSDCPHEGMECIEAMCRPREYWRSFRDRHAAQACHSREECNADQVCGFDRWIMLRVKERSVIKPIKEAVARLKHPSIDVDLYVALSQTGALTSEDIRNMERVGGEVWLVGVDVEPEARKTLKQRPVTVRRFASEDEVMTHITSLPRVIDAGTCAGVPCTVDTIENEIGSWKYFEYYANHRGSCSSGRYCATRNVLTDEGRCEAYMPVVLNPLMIEFYNSNVVSQLQTQPLPNACLVLGLKGYFRLGFSFLKTSVPTVWQRIRWSEIIGFTDKAMHLGGTTPLDYAVRDNTFYLGSESVEYYDSVLLTVPRNEDVASVIERVRRLGFDLSSNSKFAQKAGEMLMIITLTFLLISFIIILISALNISHTFLMVVFERQRELGTMRAIGASRWDIRKIILTESLFIGLTAGLIGNGLSFAVSRLVNVLGSGLRDRFPMIPEDFFIYSWPLLLGSVGFALAFCLVGAAVPANRAARLDPAVVLSQA